MSIQLLDKNTINKIAAGEVIERPASVVKELTENSIDAGASVITVEIKDGGTSFIRVTDNGSGIDAGDIKNAFVKHATSKIRQIEDLETVMSLGFRGEALSSIASVSKVKMRSKSGGVLEGTEYIIEGGQELSFGEAGLPEGTSVIVKDLFFNTPVRKKFLKSFSAEAAAVYTVMEHFAISRPDISFVFINNGKEKLHTTGTGQLKEVIYSLYGRDITANLISVSAEAPGVQISGYIGKPAISRGNRGFENYSVNGRYIKNDSLTKAIEDAFKGYIMLHDYPFTALNFIIDPGMLDVNVHPTKREFRLTASEEVCDFVRKSIREAIEGRNVIPDVKPESVEEPETSSEEEAVKQPVNHPVNHPKEKVSYIAPVYLPDESNMVMSEPETENKPFAEDAFFEEQSTYMPEEEKRFLKDGIYKEETVVEEKEEIPEPVISEKKEEFSQEELPGIEKINTFRLIGQLFSTYWLIESGDTFYMMDQHAAHEKVLYERIMKRMKDKEPQTQYLTVPQVIDMSPATAALLGENSDLYDSFKILGYEVEAFGDNAIKVTGVPAGLPTMDYRQMITDVLDGISSGRDTCIIRSDTPQLIVEKLASMSCKAAIKGNDRISTSEALELLEEMMKAENPYNCPHGRPTLVAMSKYDIEKKFKRIV